LAYKAAEAAIPFSIIPIIFDVLKHFTQDSPVLAVIASILKLIIVVTVLNLMMKKFTRKENGYVSYGRAFKYGFMLCLFSSIICTLWTALSYYVIFPDTIDTVMEASAQMYEKMGMPFDYDKIYQYLSPILICSSFIYYIFWGLVLPSILANYTKHETPFSAGDGSETEEQE